MIRKIFLSERGKVAEHLKRLDGHDRHMRFETSASDSFIDSYVGGLRFSAFAGAGDVVYGAFDDQLVLRGVAHVAFADELAEVGLSVEIGCRGQGIGTGLLDKAIKIARLHRAKTFTSMCLTHNRWMMRAMLARNFDIVRECDTAIATTNLAPASVMTYGGEMVEENLAWIDYAQKLWFNIGTNCRAFMGRPKVP